MYIDILLNKKKNSNIFQSGCCVIFQDIPTYLGKWNNISPTWIFLSSLKLTFSPLKINGWKMIFLLGPGLFSGPTC